MFYDLRLENAPAPLVNAFYACFRTSDGGMVKRLIMPAAVSRVRSIIERGNEYEIDNFCYRIY